MTTYGRISKVTFEVDILVNKSLDGIQYSIALIQLTNELRGKYISNVMNEISEVAPGRHSDIENTEMLILGGEVRKKTICLILPILPLINICIIRLLCFLIIAI